MSEEGIKRGIGVIEQFFKSMEKLDSDAKYFVSECKSAIEQQEASIKIYALAFNFAWTLRYTIHRLQEYEDVLRNTLLYDYFEENQKKVDDFGYLTRYLENFISGSLVSIYIEIDNDDQTEIEIDDNEGDNNIIEDHEYLETLSKDLSANGGKILHIIPYYLLYINKKLIEIRNIRRNRTDNDYLYLFEREFKEFLTTDSWNDLQVSFIDTTISIKYRGIEPTIDQLQDMRDNEFAIMTELRKDLGSFDAYLKDKSKLARHIVNREIKHNSNNSVMELFSCLGRMKLIDDWLRDINEEAPLMEAYADTSPSDTITFSERLSEERLKSLWPQIEEIYNNRKAIDWVCFYHVLVYRNYISCDDFKLFARWINETSGREVISEVNIRQIKMSYWAKEAKRMWTIDGLHNWRNTAKADSQYRDFELLGDEINELIK